MSSIEDTSPRRHKYQRINKIKSKQFSFKSFKKSSIGDTRPLELKYLTNPKTLDQ